MKKLLFALILTGCGGEVSVIPDMDPTRVDLSNDIPPGKPSEGSFPGGIHLPPCARPEIDQCLGPPSQSDRLKRPVEMDVRE